LIYRNEITRVISAADENLAGLMSMNFIDTSLAPVRYVVKLLTRMVQLFRDFVSYQNVCQLVKIDETKLLSTGYFETFAVRCSLAQCANKNELEIQKHAWTACYDCFQNEARPQLEALGYLSAYYSFSLAPVGREDYVGDLESDLYLCARIGKRSDIYRVIYSRACIDSNGKRGEVTDIGFPL
jgi:hypothetical protein